jgi:hypothetical protein
MSYEYRQPIFNFSASLSAGCTALDTTLSSTGFNNLPTISGGSAYIPMVLANDAQGKEEVVWVTNHTAAATSVTVVRGREGTTAQAFSAGDVIRCTPTLRDVISSYTRSTLPADAHYGMRSVLTDENITVEKTSTGWDDSSPFKSDPARKHRFVVTGASVPAATSLNITLPTTQTTTTGTIATVSSGNLLLNRAGVWSLAFHFFDTSASNRNSGVIAHWPSGAFPGTDYIWQVAGAIGGSQPGGNNFRYLTWVGYVNAAQAAAPITVQAFISIAIGCNIEAHAEYLGG